MIKFKKYKCKKCGFVKKIETNHYGECYSLGRYNHCTNPKSECSWLINIYRKPTTWICMEKPPKGEKIPAKRRKSTILIKSIKKV